MMKPREWVALIAFLALVAVVYLVAACTIVIGDRNKVEAPDIKARTEIDFPKAQRKADDERAPLQNHSPAK